MFFTSQNIDFPILFVETLGAFLFSFPFSILSLSLSLSMLRLFEDLGILMINKEKNTLQNFIFRWNGMEWLSHDYRNRGTCGYIGGGCIFQNGVMHTNIIRCD
jgi:hypothetical protein